MDIKKYKNKIIAHRGIHNNIDIPENSLLAFKKALELNYPIELDIHLTIDNNIVVFHDNNLKRMTGVDKDIEKLTLKEIKKLNLLDTKEKIPTLSEVLSLVNNKVLLDIEIKGKNKKLIDILLNTLESYQGEIIIKSFNPIYIKLIKKKTNKYTTGLLLSTTTKNKKYNLIAKSNFIISYCNPDFLAISKNLLNTKRINKLKSKYPLLVWTIKTKEELKKIKSNNLVYISDNLPFKKGN